MGLASPALLAELAETLPNGLLLEESPEESEEELESDPWLTERL